MVAKGTKTKKNPLLEDEEVINNTSEVEETEETQDDSEEEVVEETKSSKKKAPQAKEVAPVGDQTIHALNSDIKMTKNILDKEPKVQFMIPLAEGEKAGAVHDCFINGHHVAVKKGVMTFVPQSIATLLADHYKITSEAGEGFRVDLDDKKQTALQ